MLSQAQTTLLEALKASLFSTVPQYPDNTNWSDVFEEAKAQTVIGLVAPVVPADWSVQTAQNTATYIRLLHEQSQLVKPFDEHSIPLVILKGAAAAMYYPRPHCRTMGDIDILVPRNRFSDAAQLMRSSGHECIQELEQNPRHMEFVKGGVMLELHHHFSSVGFDVDDILEEAIPRRVNHELGGQVFPALPDMENGLVLLGHIQQHLMNNGLGLRQVIDWMMFVHSSLTDEAWENQFKRLVQQVGLETLAINVTKMCKDWLGLPDQITWCEDGDDELAEDLLSILFECGNMGRKGAADRSATESVTQAIRREGLFRFLWRYGYGVWPLAKRHKALRPLAMVYGTCRLACKGLVAALHGENIASQISNGNDRYEFYKRLGLRV